MDTTGRSMFRWNADGTENEPGLWTTRQFHLIPMERDAVAFSLIVPAGARFIYRRRGSLYIAGWEWTDEPGHGCFVFAGPDGVEVASDHDHALMVTRRSLGGVD